MRVIKRNKKSRILYCLLAIAVLVSMTPIFGNVGDVNAATGLAAPSKVVAKAKTKTSITISWGKVTKAKGYVVYRSSGKSYKKIKTTSKKSYTNSKLKKNKVYKYKIKAYQKKGKKKIYGKTSYVVSSKAKSTNSIKNVTSIKLSKTMLTLQNGKAQTIKATLGKGKKLVSKKIVWSTSNAAVTSVVGGKITAKKEGTCTITARAHNGLTAKMTVKVISAEPGAVEVQKMLTQSTAGTKYADQVGNTLAYDDAYFDESSGFRTAGSDAEHAASKYLANQFKSIGLKDVERVPVTVDKWQFNEAYLSLKYTDSEGASKSIRINDMVSYASAGTVQNGGNYTDIDIVDMNMGTKADYDKYYAKTGTSDMSGKIVLVGVDQWNEVWIDGPYMEAKAQKAAGLVTYSMGGYAQYDNDTINVQDLCAPNLGIPCTSISKNNAAKIQAALKTGTNVKANYYVDNEVGEENGTSYNVVGKIKGTGNTGQQIIVAAHYDKYFYGFEDDSVAVGLVAGMAKTMVDSGYKPVNDIVFVAHGSEEWGEFDTSTDWAAGSWEMITEAHPEWQGSTLALINFELPGINDYNSSGIMRTNYEFGEIGSGLLKSDLVKGIKGYYKNGVEVANDDEATMTDCVAYQFNGVPFVMPRQKDRTTWTKNRYHTQRDTNSEVDSKGDGVYSKDLLKYDLELYNAMAIYIDSNPALEMDFGSRCDELDNALKGTEAYATPQQITDYKAALNDFRVASKTNLEKSKKINENYAAAYKKDDVVAMKKARDEGISLNNSNLKAFKYSQDKFVGLADYGDTEIHHKAVQNNLDLYNQTISSLTDGTVTEDDIWVPSEINGYYEYYAYLFSDEVCSQSYDVVQNVNVDDNWGTDKMTPAIKDAWKTTKKMISLWNDGNGPTASAAYSGVTSEYQGYVTTLTNQLKNYMNQEIQGMQKIKDMI